MHIIKADGASKYTFGHVTEESDIRPSGPRYPVNYTIGILGEAHVPVGDQTIVFYMDKVSIGEYIITGRINFTTGYKKEDLAEGPGVRVARPAPVPAPERLEMPQAPPEEADIIMEADNSWRTTYKAFPNGPEPFLVNTYDHGPLEIFDYGGQAAAVTRPNGARLLISGTFETKKGRPMLRPYGSAKDGMWHGVDPDDMIAEVEIEQEPDDELLDTDFDLPTRAAMKKNGYTGKASRVSFQERYIDLPLAWTQSQLIEAQGHIDRIKINIKDKLWK
jgi:hypothetical protein